MPSEISALEKSLKEMKVDVEERLLENIAELKEQLNYLSASSKNIFRRVVNSFKTYSVKRNLKNKENNFDLNLAFELEGLNAKLNQANNRYQFVTSSFDKAVLESSRIQLNELERKKLLIDQIKNDIYGAIGEQKVVKALENLSNDYYLINDFCYAFHPAIYNRRENDYIKSVQLDHLLIAPSGIFIIETKNWSADSMKNINLRSPVQQIKRANFALYHLIRKNMPDFTNFSRHHWGERKISTRNCIVFINNKPNEEFEHVKVLSLAELPGYIKYFKPIFSDTETEKIAKYFISICK